MVLLDNLVNLGLNISVNLARSHATDSPYTSPALLDGYTNLKRAANEVASVTNVDHGFDQLHHGLSSVRSLVERGGSTVQVSEGKLQAILNELKSLEAEVEHMLPGGSDIAAGGSISETEFDSDVESDGSTSSLGDMLSPTMAPTQSTGTPSIHRSADLGTGHLPGLKFIEEEDDTAALLNPSSASHTDIGINNVDASPTRGGLVTASDFSSIRLNENLNAADTTRTTMTLTLTRTETVSLELASSSTSVAAASPVPALATSSMLQTATPNVEEFDAPLPSITTQRTNAGNSQSSQSADFKMPPSVGIQQLFSNETVKERYRAVAVRPPTRSTPAPPDPTTEASPATSFQMFKAFVRRQTTSAGAETGFKTVVRIEPQQKEDST